MKKRILSIICLMAIMVSCFAAGVYGANNIEEIKAYLNYGITIKFDGQTQNMYNANGKQVFPISYEGTTYVPIRAVSGILGVDVEWDGATNTVLLGKTGTAKNFIEMEPYEGINLHRFLPQDNEPRVIAGKEYSEYILLTDFYGDAYYNLGGKYKVLKFDAYSTNGTSINFYGDNDELISVVNIKGKELPTTHKINLTNVTRLKIENPSTSFLSNDGYIFNATIE